MNITINNLTISFQATPPMAGRPQIGEYWQGQGGIYAGEFCAVDGSIYGLIVAQEQDIGSASWGKNGSYDKLSKSGGLANTTALLDVCPAAKLAAGYTRDGHTDFYLPALRELLLGAASLYDTFGTESLYWTSTPYIDDYAKAFDFELGACHSHHRLTDFRVRPFRRFIY